MGRNRSGGCASADLEMTSHWSCVQPNVLALQPQTAPGSCSLVYPSSWEKGGKEGRHLRTWWYCKSLNHGGPVNGNTHKWSIGMYFRNWSTLKLGGFWQISLWSICKYNLLTLKKCTVGWLWHCIHPLVCVCKSECVHAQSLTCVQLLGTPWIVACQAPLSMGFSRQEYWSGLLFLSPGNLSNPGIKPGSFMSPALACMYVLFAQSACTVCDPMACSQPNSSVMGFSRQKYWIVLPFPAPGDFPHLGIEPGFPHCRQTADGFFSTSATWEAIHPLIPQHTEVYPQIDFPWKIPWERRSSLKAVVSNVERKTEEKEKKVVEKDKKSSESKGKQR